LTDYGLGWRIARDGQGRLWIGHGGGSVGGTSHFWIFPEQRVVLAAASNLIELDDGLLLLDLRDLIEAGDQSIFSPLKFSKSGVLNIF